MAKYRQIHTTFWNDSLVLDLTPEQKYFYLYLLTNPNVTQCGIYEISLKQISYPTGYNKDTILNLLEHFSYLNKIVYSKDTNEIAVCNFLKYNASESPSVKKCIEKDLKCVKNKDLIKYLYSEDTVYTGCIGNKEEEEEEKEKKNNNNIEQSKLDFSKKVYKCKDYEQYHEEFLDYWLEEDSNNNYRFMSQKFFNVEKRLERWKKNQYSKNKNKFPDYYDAYIYKKLDTDNKNLYESHLKKLGWTSTYSPTAGQVWNKKK